MRGLMRSLSIPGGLLLIMLGGFVIFMLHGFASMADPGLSGEGEPSSAWTRAMSDDSFPMALLLIAAGLGLLLWPARRAGSGGGPHVPSR